MLSCTAHDTTGAIVVGATIKCVNNETREERTAISLGNGNYCFDALQLGYYIVSAIRAGFANMQLDNVVLSPPSLQMQM